MKSILFLGFILIISINSIEEYPDAHYINLDNDKCTIDGIELISQIPIFGATFKKGVVNIVEKGTYIVSGELNGKLNIALESNETAKIILNGVNINSTINAIAIESGYELINTIIEDDPRILKQIDFNKAGVQIILADDSINYLYGDEDGKQNGAVYSAITLHIKGESKGNGKLFINSKMEGIEVYKHLCISGGYVNVASVDDGINTKTDKDSVIFIKGGKVIVNGGLGSEGDGIDGNGYILIDGGEIISSAHPNSDSGLDSNFGILIDKGQVYAVGCSMDMAEKESEQPTMNLIFNSSVLPNNTITIKDSSGNDIISYNADKAEFIEGTKRKTYSAAIVSHPRFESGKIYHIYMDGVQLGYTSNKKGGFGPMPGPGPDPFPPGPPPGPGPEPPFKSIPGNNDRLRKLEDNTLKADFIMGEGATFYSGIQKYVPPEKNNGKYLNFYLYLLLVFLYMI